MFKPGEEVGRIPADRMCVDESEPTKNSKKRRWRGAEPACSRLGTAEDAGTSITQAEMNDRRKVLNHVYGPEVPDSLAHATNHQDLSGLG